MVALGQQQESARWQSRNRIPPPQPARTGSLAPSRRNLKPDGAPFHGMPAMRDITRGQEQGFRFWPAAVAVLFLIASGGIPAAGPTHHSDGDCLFRVTGIGAVGALLLGMLAVQRTAQVMRILSVSLIIVGIVGLKLTSDH